MKTKRIQRKFNKPFIYLASPYTCDDHVVRQQRFETACWAAAWFMKQGHIVFSPIAHSHYIACHGLTQDHDFWMRQDRAFLAEAAEVWVLCMEGWRQSRGVTAEIKLARSMRKLVRFFDIEFCPKNILEVSRLERP